MINPIIESHDYYHDRRLFIWPEQGYWLIAKSDFWDSFTSYIDKKLNDDLEYEEIKYELQIRGINEGPENFNYSDLETPLYLVPTNLVISMTDNCNLSCPYCYANSGPNKSSFLNIESAKKAIDFVSVFNNISEQPYSAKVSFVGGEPLLNKNLFALLRYAFDNYFIPTLTTNGTLDITESQVKMLIEAKVEVNVSIDGFDAKTHSLTRSSSFDKVFKFCKRLITCGIPVSVTSVIHENNIEYLEQIIEFFYSEKFSGISLNSINQMGRGSKFKSRISKIDLFSKLFDICISKPYLKDFLKPSSFYFFIFRLSKSLTQKDCGLSNKAFYLNSDGKMYICGALKDAGSEFDYLSLDNGIILKTNDKCDKIIEKFGVENITKCNDCLYKYFCAGECRGEAEEIFNNALEVHPDCRNIQRLFKEMMFKLSDYPEFIH